MIEMKRRKAIELKEKRLSEARMNETQTKKMKTTTLTTASMTSMRSSQSSHVNTMNILMSQQKHTLSS